MKNINLILKSLLVCLFIVSCENDDNTTLNGGNSDSGWIQFDEMSSKTFTNKGITAIPFSLPYGTNAQGQVITYSIDLISGTYPADELGNFKVKLDALDQEGTIDFTPIMTGENYNLRFTLLSTTNPDYQIGLSDGSKQVTYDLEVCNFEISATYTGDAFSNDLGLNPGDYPAYTSTFTPVPGETNMWTLDTTWGPNFVSTLCAGCVTPGSLPYPSTITLNDDNSVTVTASAPFSGGTGTYDPCTDQFTLKIGQTVFANTFKADIVLTGN